MNILIRNFRLWWQPPRNIRERPAHRQVSFLELFYDLVYVVLIAELTHALAIDVSLTNVANFAFLFIIVWWAWFNGSIYHELHGNDDIRTRVFTFLQMFSVAGMAIFAHDALGETAVGFALSYIFFQLILAYLWWRTGVYDPNHRPLSQPYIITFLIAIAVFFISLFVEPSLRFYMWGIATVITVLLPVYAGRFVRNTPSVQEQRDLSRKPTPSLIERFGLFTIIVLGEVVVAVVQGVAGQHDLTWQIGTIGVLSMTVAIGFWWLYFDFVSHRLPQAGTGWVPVWIYTHLPVTAGIATAGAAILNVIEQTSDAELPGEIRWLLVGSIAMVLASIALLIQTLDTPVERQQTHRIGQVAMLIAAILIVVLGISNLQTIPLLLIIVVLMLMPVLFGFLSLVRGLELARDKAAS